MLNRFSLLLFSLLLIFLISACGEEKKEKTKAIRPVKVITIKQSTGEIVRAFPGKVLASEEAVLSFLVSGQLIKLPILEGQQVKRKEFLAQLESTKFQQAYNEANANYIKAKAHFHRAEVLVKDKYISEAQYDNMRAAYLSAKATLNSAKKDLDDTTLYAPFDGVISVKYVDNFEFVKAKQPIFKLQDLSHIDIEINVPENVMVNIRKDTATADDDEKNPLVVIFDSVPHKEYKAVFKEFSAQADPETQTYRVTLKMPAPKDINVLPGMTATIRTRLPDYKSRGKKYIEIPVGAVFSDNNKTYVWLVDPKAMTVKKQIVIISRIANSDIHVLSGLKPGDKIVAAGVHYLQEGQKISFLKTNGSD